MVWVILAVVAAIVIWLISAYNNIVRMKNRLEEADSTVDVHLNKRYDLIPNLVETVKGYARHESETLEKVIAARNSAMTASGVAEKDAANNILSGTLKSLFALSENYPELKADTSFVNLQNQLEKVETEILNARKYYNGCARAFNDKILVFPVNLISGMMHFQKAPYSEVAEEAKQRVDVKF